MKAVQDKVEKFNKEREWGKVSEIKDLLLNIDEEIGELWHIIKWVDAEKQKELLEKNKGEVGNFIGDMQYLLLKIAFICGINSEEETLKVLEEYEKRFPVDEIKKFKHANKLAGGIDNK
ncbi:hypothetical protein A3K73_05905 [Candidatus Pacearchaeota archaeon RBG_13_36_9]|nr:MAG: hypothetical protein A3K73_05905 [Candidatus Pacearchaeota archaeon RBG_13_36_9]